MPAFPPGPFEIVPGEDELTWSILDDDCEVIADVYGDDREMAANTAALLGAAPALFHACVSAIQAIDSNSPRHRIDARDQLRRAIAEADAGPKLLEILVTREGNRQLAMARRS